ncbi:MAG: DUF881 domain-containing protein [Bacillota bacterium]|nr:DUF881 domain-containing protein [Bacillota bacterium]
MARNDAKYFILIGSIVIGTLVSSNIDTGNRSFKILNAAQYKEAIDERYSLKNDIEGLSDKYSKAKLKLEKYNDEDTSKSEILKDIQKELNFNNVIAGTTEVSGPGIEITLKDSIEDYYQTNDIYSIIHDQDMIQVINDVKNSGAEAIEINGIRIIDRTKIYCNGYFLRINGVLIAAPFNISAIGNKDSMRKYLLSPDNYLAYLQVRGIYVSIDDNDNIKIPPYQGSIDSSYLSDPSAKK